MAAGTYARLVADAIRTGNPDVDTTAETAMKAVAKVERANFEATLEGKWLELLSEIAPGLKRIAIMFNPDTASRIDLYALT
jgi:hypothetical protein